MDNQAQQVNPQDELEKEAGATIRKSRGYGRRGCDQLLFNDDGSLLFVTDDVRSMCKLVNSKMEVIGAIKTDLDWRIKEMMITGPNEVATVSISDASADVSPCMKFWDVRTTKKHIASSFFYGRTAFMSSVYSKKDDLFLTLDRNATGNLLATYNRKGVLQHSSDTMPLNLSDSVKSIALSPDESILVMETVDQSYTVVRKLDLGRLFDDIRPFRPAYKVSPREEDPLYSDVYNDFGIERFRIQQYRNSPEVMFYKTDSEVRMCPCKQSSKSVSFSPHNDFFASHIESFRDERYFYKIRRYPSRTVLTFDLLEHRIAKRRNKDRQPELYARYARDDMYGRSYLNLPLWEKKIQTFYGKVGDPLRPHYWYTPHENPLLYYEARSYCSIGAGKIAVTTVSNKPLVAVGDDRYQVEIYSSNEEFTLVQKLKIDVTGGLRRLAFSPRDSGLVVSDSEGYLHWYDIEYKVPIVSNALVSDGETDQSDSNTNSCKIL